MVPVMLAWNVICVPGDGDGGEAVTTIPGPKVMDAAGLVNEGLSTMMLKASATLLGAVACKETI